VLVTIEDIIIELPDDEPHPLSVESFNQDTTKHEFVGFANEILKKHIGEIPKDRAVHFITSGRYSAHDLLLYILKQTGPADVLISTWSISEAAIRSIVQKYEEKIIRSIGFLIDPRIKNRNPKPLQMLIANFKYKFKACHAKVTLIGNESWKISVIGSANMTQNPRIERGVILPFPEVYEFDKKWILDEIGEGDTGLYSANG
jgi:hypothetical protein